MSEHRAEAPHPAERWAQERLRERRTAQGAASGRLASPFGTVEATRQLLDQAYSHGCTHIDLPVDAVSQLFRQVGLAHRLLARALQDLSEVELQAMTALLALR